MIRPDLIEQTIREASSFRTRHTLTPGYGEACDWLEGKFRDLGYEPERLRASLPAGPRIPAAMEADQVTARLPGETDEWIVVGAHLDSLNLAGPPGEVTAPGANDNASGLSVVLECARAISGRRLQCGVLFMGFAAEEQGLLGAKHLASVARSSGWRIRGVLTWDMIGSPANERGEVGDHEVRLFSEEGASRELARWIEWTTRSEGFGVKLVNRHDRFGRGGDHTPFAQAGFPAVRFTELRENYSVQHSDRDVMENLSVEYVARTAEVSVRALAGLASAGPPPSSVRIVRDQSHDTTLEWDGDGEFEVLWRDTRSSVWEDSEQASGPVRHVVAGVNKDDHVFGVAAVGGVPVVAV